jgi:hypothetical protein
LHDTFWEHKYGSLRVVLENDVYRSGKELAENIIRKWSGPEKNVDIKDAASDS